MTLYLAVGSIIGAFGFYTLLVLRNLKMLKETKQERLEARRAYRKARAARWKYYTANIRSEMAAKQATAKSRSPSNFASQ